MPARWLWQRSFRNLASNTLGDFCQTSLFQANFSLPARRYRDVIGPEMAGRRFKFAWSRTWPDRPQDFVAHDGDLSIGRVYRIAGVAERWKWSMTAWLGNRAGS